MIFFLILSVIHILIFAWLWYQWSRVPNATLVHRHASLRFSVIVPVRNEEVSIARLLRSIDRQTYPNHLFEVLVVDDHSEDNTRERVKKMVEEVSYPLRYISAAVDSGKKSALTLGVQLSKYDYIIATDGDCEVGIDWIKSYALHFEQTDLVMVTGAVKMTGVSVLSDLQQVEFASLIGIGAGALHSGNPSMCNGANLSYQKKVFEEVDGYVGNADIPSGDDEFLLQKVFARYPDRIGFLRNKQNVVLTPSKPTLSSLLNQRLRWMSKWRYHKSWFVVGGALCIYVDYLTFTLSMIFAVLGIFDAKVVGVVLLLRWMSNFLYARSVGSFFEFSTMKVAVVTLCLQIIYPLFVTMLGLASIFGRYSWKGRKYR